ncbi:MAG: hypothetical protein KA105_03065 [Caulobacter sp.]|nr:hypothetical protein [Caulobacter sp.]
MRIFVPDMAELFSWLEQSGWKYVVLRNAPAFVSSYPPVGGKDDVDLLVEDAALAPIKEKYGRYRRRQGVKCDFYDVSGTGEGTYCGEAYYPRALAELMLNERERFADRFHVAAPKGYLYGLIYHIAYQKAERSKIDREDAEKSGESKYVPELRDLMARSEIELPLTLTAFDDELTRVGLRPTYRQLAAILVNDFSRDVKSRFLAQACDRFEGEMNLFVIRKIALKKGLVEAMADRIREHYDVIAETDIPWMVRMKTSKRMRGGKWRRGGHPVRAMVVYDPSPNPTTEEDRKVHPFVFNSRQFMKRGLRDWFAETTGLDPWHNPLHSTDNEAEAMGHLNLFFSPAERDAIYDRLAVIRAGKAT